MIEIKESADAYRHQLRELAAIGVLQPSHGQSYKEFNAEINRQDTGNYLETIRAGRDKIALSRTRNVNKQVS
jgi:hypothetical protein